ncbi:MAG: M28 family peptidase [bacterium]
MFSLCTNLVIVFATISCGNSRTASLPTFNGEQAYQYLVKQCEFGPRVPGTKPHRECLDFITRELQRFGAKVIRQPFLQNLPRINKTVTMTNIIASFGLEKENRILLCAHWDTRPWADQDPELQNRDRPIIGANDGASGVAILLEVARNIQIAEPKFGVDIIFFDGEDAGLSGQTNSYALGSQYFAKNKDFQYRPLYGILVDMVGDKDLQIYQEENSVAYAPQIVEKVWNRAQSLNLPAFIPTAGYEVTDDHLPLLQVGIPCINIIDFDYDYWHTLGDTPDKCSPESLTQVGQLLLSLLYED